HLAGVLLDRGRELGLIHHDPSRPGGQHTDQHLRLWSSPKRPSAPASGCGISPSADLPPQGGPEGPSMRMAWCSASMLSFFAFACWMDETSSGKGSDGPAH